MCNRNCQDYKKRKLSASVDGRGIKVAATASPGTLIHEALNSIAANEWDEIYLRAVNTSSTAVKLTLEWGGTEAPDDQVELSISAEDGFHDVVTRHILQNSREVRAFADTANAIVLHGYVNRYENTQG